jgi:hypothetical protein
LGRFLKIAQVAVFFWLLFPWYIKLCINFGPGNILGDLFKNSSGHPVGDKGWW